MYRSVSTSIWADDAILSMSPEQKLLFLYLHTNPYASACGIYKMQLRTMGFQVGLMSAPFESALRGLASAFPDFVAVDWQTNEVALLQYPRQNMIDISPGIGAKFFAHIKKEIEKVESQYLLRELIARNSSTLSAPYLAQFRRLQMQVINGAKIRVDNVEGVEVVLYGDDAQPIENQEDTRKTRNLKLKTETKKKENTRAREDETASKTDTPVSIPDTPDWKKVATAMYEHTLNGGKDDWEFLKASSGYMGDGRDIFATWAGKANAYQLRNWKDEFRKLGTWMRNEARANLKNQPRQEQATPMRRPIQPKPQRERHIFTLDDAPEEVRARLQKHGL